MSPSFHIGSAELVIRPGTLRAPVGVIGAVLALGLVAGVPSTAQLSPPDLILSVLGSVSIDVGDVNNDGMIDIVFAAFDSNSPGIRVLLQRRDGTFDPPRVFGDELTPSVVVGDFNGDGLADIARPLLGGIGLLVQSEFGTLEEADLLTSPETGLMLRVGDFNNDGRDDLASLPPGDFAQDVYIFLQGDAGLLAPQAYPLNHTEFYFNDLKVGDLNGDALHDLVVVSSALPADNNIALLLQDPDGGFEGQVLYDAPGSQTYDSVAIGDVNHDGLNDLVVGADGSFLQIFTQTQAGTLEFFGDFDLPAEEELDSLEIRDLDADGLNEIFGVSEGTLLILDSPAHPGGLAIRETHYLMSDQFWAAPHHLAVQDLNGDGVLDVTVANINQGVQVLLGDARVFSDGFESGNIDRWSASQN